MAITLGGLGVGTLSRVAVLVMGGIATAGMCLILGLMLRDGALTSGEQLSRSLAWAVLFLYGLPYGVCVIPALVLAILDRWLPVALALCVLAVPFFLLLVRYA